MKHIAIVKCSACGYEGMGKIYGAMKDASGWVFTDPKCP